MLDTMKIVSSDTECGYVIINAGDFDAATMVAVEDGRTADVPNGEPGEPPAPRARRKGA